MKQSSSKVSPGMESSSQIEDRAAAWLAKRDSGRWSEDDERELQSWLDGATAHMVAFIRLEAVWGEARRLKALGAGMQPGIVPPPNSWHLSPFLERPEGSGTVDRSDEAPALAPSQPPPPRRSWSTRALAAGLVLAVAAALTWYLATSGFYYRTPVGGLASIPMSDGSKVTLNTDSAIRLAVTDQIRGVELERGEAFFEVAKDPSRPFVVTVGNKRVIAVGTKFSVRRTGDEVQVLVTEGKVRLEDDSLTAASRKTAGSSEPATSAAQSGIDGTNHSSAVRGGDGGMLLVAGAVAHAGESGVLVRNLPLMEVDDHLTWRSGYLTFRETPLAAVSAEFNRYNNRQIVIEDPVVAGIRISGKFRSNGFEAFVRLLEQGFPIQAQYSDGRIILNDAHDAGGGEASLK